MEKEQFTGLEERAKKIRRHIVTMVGEAKSGHPGGALSAADIVTTLFFKEMKIDPNNPSWSERDRFVLCKGHAAPVLYGALAEKGFFPVEEIMTLRKTGARLQGHPDMKKVPGVDMSTGSLGQGLSVAGGMALAAKLDNAEHKVYALLGDGELQEGQVWEAAMSAAHYKLDNLVAFVDHNGLQIDGAIEEVLSPEPVTDKFRAFGWHVISIDGHDFKQIIDALDESKTIKDQPTVIVAETVKGKGISYMENQAGWHGKAPSPEQVQQAIDELIK